jgi:hypothetical protein
MKVRRVSRCRRVRLRSQTAFRTNSDLLEESHGVTVERLSQTTHRTKDLELGHFMKQRGQNLSSSLKAVGRLELDIFNNLIRPTGMSLLHNQRPAMLDSKFQPQQLQEWAGDASINSSVVCSEGSITSPTPTASLRGRLP